MKTITCGFFAVVMSLGMISANAYGAILFQDNFDNSPTGAFPTGWNQLGGTGGASAVVVEGIYDTPYKSVHFYDQDSNDFIQMYHYFPQTTYITAEWKMLSNGSDYKLSGTLLGDKDSSQSSVYGLGFGEHSGYLGVYHNTGGAGEKPDLMSYDVGKWYLARMTVDTTIHKLSFYVEEVENSSKNALFEIIDPTYTQSYIDQIAFSSPMSLGNSDGYIDSVVVSPVPEPSTFVIFGAVILLAFAWRRRNRTA